MAKLDRLQPAGMKLIERGQQRLHSDVYFDTPRLRLRAVGANLRIRTGSMGERWVTLKQKTRGGHKGAVNIRLESEVQLTPGALAEDSAPWRAAMAVTSPELRP